MGSTGKPRRARPVTHARLRQDAQRMAGVALDALKEIMAGDVQAAVRLAAAREILDRGYGRPKLGDGDATPEEMTVIVRKFTDPPGCREVDDGGRA